jgi:hypothetical protein
MSEVYKAIYKFYNDALSEDFDLMIRDLDFSDKIKSFNLKNSSEIIQANLKYLNLLKSARKLELNTLRNCLHLADIFYEYGFGDLCFVNNIEMLDYISFERMFTYKHIFFDFDTDFNDSIIDYFRVYSSDLESISEFSFETILKNLCKVDSEQKLRDNLRKFKEGYIFIKDIDKKMNEENSAKLFPNYSFIFNVESPSEETFSLIDYYSEKIKLIKLSPKIEFTIYKEYIGSFIRTALFDINNYLRINHYPYFFIKESVKLNNEIDNLIKSISSKLEDHFNKKSNESDINCFKTLEKIFSLDKESFNKMKDEYFSSGDSVLNRVYNLKHYFDNVGYKALPEIMNVATSINDLKKNINRFEEKSFELDNSFYFATDISYIIENNIKKELEKIKKQLENDPNITIDLNIFDLVSESFKPDCDKFKQLTVLKGKEEIDNFEICNYIYSVFSYKKDLLLKKQVLDLIKDNEPIPIDNNLFNEKYIKSDIPESLKSKISYINNNEAEEEEQEEEK